ncbi:T9SS type A sorting domain-containing protein [Chitinophaga filiformis]|uniref:T9SS type A sorting domain-containing protein n=1 Tax=Chitinophaga filiformis TaxID=104663 RepID=UPI001F2FC550|nr:T9SS type A sorting domain-containing protein [Chitinophaga filiformis]MCF6407193.1 T9SS type A sorting domain-containing protein [Chitinophaga filiformis]
MPKNNGSVTSALKTALCVIPPAILTAVQLVYSKHLSTIINRKRFLYVLPLLLMNITASAQFWHSTEPARMYIAIDPVNNNYLDHTFATWPYTLNGPKFVATPIHQTPTEYLYYMDTIVVNPPWMIYEVYDYSSYIYMTVALEYIREIYPVNEAALAAPTMGLGVPFYPLDNYHTSNGQRTDEPINIQFYYLMVPPWKLKNYTAEKSVCASAKLNLVSIGDNVTNPENNDYYQGTYVLEYNVGPDLTTGWKAIDSTIGAFGYGFTITPAHVIPEVADTKRNVWFRHRQKAVYNNGATVLYSRWSEPSDPIEISPAPPTVDAAQIAKTPGCYNEGGGTISVPGSAIHTGFSTIRWTLRKGIVSTPCDPDLSNPGSNCGDLLAQSNGAVPVSGGINIDNVPKGTYTLWVFNPGETTGSCMTPYYITIDEYAPLTATENTNQHKNISCYGGSDGVIGITAGGADTNAAYYFELRSGSTIIRPEQAGVNQSILWENLPAGTYQAIVRNASCANSTPPLNVVLQQPIQVSGNAASNDPTCTSPGNGAISIAAATTGNYEFKLYQNDVVVKTSGVLNNTITYTFTDLAGGTYRAAIVNGDAPLCAGWDSTLTLQALSPLAVSLTSSDSISCFGGNDGSLQFTASGGTGQYQYTVNGTTNSTGLFTGLSAGTYTVTVTNQDNTCSDAVTADADIYQRAALDVQLSTTPISCYGAADALISANVNGGSGNYNYRWQQLKNGTWTDGTIWYSTDTKIEALDAGSYRLIVTDNKATGCAVTSTESTIPALAGLTITSIQAQDAVCLSDGAHINMTATGGTPGYQYEWSTDNGNSYQPFTPGTAIMQSGTYKLRLKDAHGCFVDAEKSYPVTLPDQPLSFTYRLSDYNGYNVGCAGGNNGYIDITATGGNGAGYQGYAYAIDNSAYSTETRITGITSGTHTIHVKDGRGCINSQQVNFTAPVSTISLKVLSKTHNGCSADPVGQITLETTGGSQPYTYSLNKGPWQSSATFANLAAGDYDVAVQDAAGCVNSISTTLTAAYEPIQVTAAISPVSCFGLSDGTITVNASGGSGNYSYHWQTITADNQARELPAGDYPLEITDSKGCKQSVTYTVPQPAQLILSIDAPAICDGLSDGSISATVTGGTPPYQYALDQSSWLPAGTFNGLAPGSYRIDVQDAHQCAQMKQVTIEKSNAQPEVNFLLSSRMNARDTLAVREICLPAPDDVKWTFHPDAVYLSMQGDVPLIKFNNPGTYWVEMNATFGQCSYTLRKALEIGAYDPSAGPSYTQPVHVIDTVMLSPNPNDGHFTYNIKLNRKQQMIVYVYDLNGVVADKRQYAPTLEVHDSFTVNGTSTGIFILRVITQSESRDVRFMISR